MKKILATAAAAVLAAATLSAGDGLKVSGFVRGGLSDDITDSVADAVHSKADDVNIGTKWVDGDHWGAKSAGRFNATYDGDNGGVDFRFQHNLTSSDSFGMGDVKFAQAWASFFDNVIIVEGGKLFDKYTTADDDIGYGFDGVNGDYNALGVRLVLHPIEQLYITVAGSSFNPAVYDYDAKYITEGSADYDETKARRQGNEKFDHNLFSATAKFENDTFAIAGGAHFSGIFYGSFSLKAIDNLTLATGFLANYSNWNEGTKLEGNDEKGRDVKKLNHFTVVDAVLEYDADPVLFGVIGYAWFADDLYIDNKNDSDFALVVPYVQYKLSDITALRAESTLHVSRDTDIRDHYATVTPSVVFNASKNADVNVWLTVSSKTDYTHHATGVGVRYKF